MLEMKYFTLKPRSKKANDPWAYASRSAMMRFAEEIEDVDPELSKEMKEWIAREEAHDIRLGEKEKALSDPWKRYRKTAIQEMRPYIPGEDLSGVSVNEKETPTEGGMIARDGDNHLWYISPEFFKKSYEAA